MGTFKGLPTVLQQFAPQELWVIWRWKKTKKGDWTKPLYQARAPKKNAKSTDPSTWAPFDAALTAYSSGQADGIGLCLLKPIWACSTPTIVATRVMVHSSQRQNVS